jgi:hypothetical protein
MPIFLNAAYLRAMFEQSSLKFDGLLTQSNFLISSLPATVVKRWGNEAANQWMTVNVYLLYAGNLIERKLLSIYLCFATWLLTVNNQV